MSIVHIGYSERGMANALCEDLSINNNLNQLSDFLTWCRFPNVPNGSSPDFDNIASATLLVEQSFSDFGDLDLLILLDHNDNRKQSVLIEAKVSTDTSAPKIISDHWREFKAFLEGDSEKTSRSLEFQNS